MRYRETSRVPARRDGSAGDSGPRGGRSGDAGASELVALGDCCPWLRFGGVDFLRVRAAAGITEALLPEVPVFAEQVDVDALVE